MDHLRTDWALSGHFMECGKRLIINSMQLMNLHNLIDFKSSWNV